MSIQLETIHLKEVLKYIYHKKEIVMFQFVNKKIQRLYKTIEENPVMGMETMSSTLDYYRTVRKLFPKVKHFVCPFDFSLLQEKEIHKFEKFSIVGKANRIEGISRPSVVVKGIILNSFHRELPFLEEIDQELSLDMLKTLTFNITKYPSLKSIKMIKIIKLKQYN